MGFALPSTKIETLKYAIELQRLSHCGLDLKEVEAIFALMKVGKFKVKKLFLDWCPEFKPVLDHLGEIKTLEYLILRGCGIEDDTFQSMMNSFKVNKVRLKLLDLYSNRLTDESAHFMGDFVSDYKFIESIGFGMNNIHKLSSFQTLFDKIGIVEVGVNEFNIFKDEWKQRENAVAKNAKAKIAKKPEDPLPYVEEVFMDESTGKYYKKQYTNLLFLNLVGNSLEKEADYHFLELLMKRATHLQLILSYTRSDKYIHSSIIDLFAPRIYVK